METNEGIPRDFYEGVVSIRGAFLDYGLSEAEADQALDEIEAIILEALEQSEGDTGEGSQDEKPSSK